MAPPLNYEWLTPPRIYFGWGCRRNVDVLAPTLGRRAFTVIGSRTLLHNGIIDALEETMRQADLRVERTTIIDHEPTVADVDQLATRLRRSSAGPGDFVLAIGGGAAIDLGKAAAALATNLQGESVRDFLEGLGQRSITESPLPLLAMPTTGGTGTEATKNAVIAVQDPPVKKSLRSPLLVPRLVLVDPELSVSVPPRTTAWTGLDAITQLIESYLCRFAQPIPQALAVDGLRRALPAVARAVRDGSDQPAREAMAHAALLSGMALANSGLGLAHGVAAALGVTANVPHGLACALMLPVALRVNRPVAEQALAALAWQTLAVGTRHAAGAADAFIEHITQLCAELEVPTRLSAVGVRADQLDELTRGSRGSSMNGNPRQLADAELRALLEEMLSILAAGLTPAWQQIMRFARLRPGEVNRAAEVHWCASGKNLNVGMALAALEAEALTLSPLGGWSGQAIVAAFAREDRAALWTACRTPTRVCTTLLDEAAGCATELVENAAPLSEGERAEFVAAYQEAAAAAEMTVLTGSLPQGTPSTFYRELLRQTPCPAVLDVRGPELLAALECRPRVVKPNREELALTLGRALDDTPSLLAAMRELIGRGAGAVVVTQGKEAVWVAEAERAWQLVPPVVAPVVNPIGCGDCLAAGLAVGLSRELPLLEAVRLGMGAAAANVAQLLPARLDPANVQRWQEQVVARDYAG